MSALLPTHNPPSYSPPEETLFSDDDVPVPSEEILPGYSAINQSTSGSGPVSRPGRGPTTRLPPKEFEYEVEGGKGPPIAVLMLVADALYSKNIPTYIGAGPIKGNVRLRSDKADGVQAIVISITGRYIAGIEEEETTILDLSTTLYSQSTELMLKPQSDSHIWPFEFKIPPELSLPIWKKGKEEAVRCVPPQTFAERMMRGSIRYEIGVKIKRGLLKTSYRISTAIGYIPLIRPPPLPLLRSLAYEQGTPLVGPDSDHEGWHTLDEVRINGPSSTTSSDVEIGCKLYMTQPLSYTIGSSIPLALRLIAPAGALHALDELIRTPNTITVRLRRTVTSYLPQQKLKGPENLPLVNRKDVKDLYEAVWWTPEQQAGGVIGNVPPEKGDINSLSDYVRWLNGEIHIGNEVKPSSGMPYFKIEYTVVLLPFTAPGAKSAETKKTKVLQEQSVEMVTSFAPGPRPVRYAPPGYTSTIVPNQASGEPFGGFLPSSGFM